VAEAGYSEELRKYRFVIEDAAGEKYEHYIFAETLDR
jgi:hypothetical protein